MLRTRELMLRHRRERRLRARPLLHFVPNMFTILGLCLGLTALRYGLDGRFELAVALVLAAAVVDGLDGRSARLLNIQSRLGAELDSLADFVDFGVVPALLVYLWTLQDVRGVGWALAMLFATCCALRLARFNTELDDPNKPRWMLNFFKGIPAPAAAGLALTPMMFSFWTGGGWARSWTLNAVMMFFVAVMMISKVPTFSLKRVRVKPDHVAPTLLALGVIVVFLVTEPWLTLSLLGIAYLLTLPAGVIVANRMRRQEAVAAAPGTAPASEAAAAPEPASPVATATTTATSAPATAANGPDRAEPPSSDEPQRRIVSFEARSPRP